jgi:hypothetical protein
MTYSYTQISQYLSCPRRYKHRYLDGWKEKDTRAAMLFGRAFEQAVAAYFQRQDAAAALYREWSTQRESGLHYSERDNWDRMLQSGVKLLDRFAQDDRIRIRQPRRNLQIKFNKPLPGQNDFVAYVDAIGELDGTRCLKELKEVGWTKGLELAKVARRDGQKFDCATWLHKARSLPKDQFKQEVEKELTGRESEPWEIIYFKVYKTQIPIVEQAIETAALMLGTDKSRGYCLEMICADFLAGANLDGEDPTALLQSMSRFFKFLPGEQRQAFLHEVTEKAS